MDPLSASSLFGQFLAERRYLRNVTTSTIEWYETAFKAFRRTADSSLIDKAALQHFVIALRQRGVKPVSCNTHIKAMNAYCRWLHEGGHHQDRLELRTLRVEKLVIQTLGDEQIRRLLTVKPKQFDQSRLHALIALLLDSGIRIDEALTLRLSGVDFDNLLVTVFGKGRKERRIPFSLELRKLLFRYLQIRGKLAGPQRPPVSVPARDDLGPAQQPSGAAPLADEAGATYVRLASTPAHVRHQLPPPGRGHRAVVDGAWAYADFDDPALSPSTDGRPEREPSEGLDFESARLMSKVSRHLLSFPH
jgi:site-specific recombinase XerD